jgi:hypothetical protein
LFLSGRRAVTGFAGVVALLGIGFHGHARELLGYAATALACRRWLADVPALGITSVMTGPSSALRGARGRRPVPPDAVGD